MTPSERIAAWVLADPDECPTLAPAFPRPPRVYVHEVRYDLEHASALALAWAGYVYEGTAPYAGLSYADGKALEDARCELCAWADRLGRPVAA